MPLLTFACATQERCTALRNLPRLPEVNVDLVLEQLPEEVRQRISSLANLEALELGEDRDYALTLCMIALFGCWNKSRMSERSTTLIALAPYRNICPAYPTPIP
eukprot:6088030-Pyramimonas_sp.AAC.1